jgi:hypothetical protein
MRTRTRNLTCCVQTTRTEQGLVCLVPPSSAPSPHPYLGVGSMGSNEEKAASVSPRSRTRR